MEAAPNMNQCSGEGFDILRIYPACRVCDEDFTMSVQVSINVRKEKSPTPIHLMLCRISRMR